MPAAMDTRPAKRICPSFISIRALKASRQSFGATKGRTPSITSISATPARSTSATAPVPYFPRLGFFRYLKKSELGSRTITSLLLRSEAR